MRGRLTTILVIIIVLVFVVLLEKTASDQKTAIKARNEMAYVEVIRMETSRWGTLGILRVNGQIIGNTLEPTYKGNEVNISSIPPGSYLLEKYDSPSHGIVWKVEGVYNRTYIEFHPGNSVEHTKGCILVGESESKLRGPKDHIRLINSGKTFDRFMSVLDNGSRYHKLVVREFY